MAKSEKNRKDAKTMEPPCPQGGLSRPLRAAFAQKMRVLARRYKNPHLRLPEPGANPVRRPAAVTIYRVAIPEDFRGSRPLAPVKTLECPGEMTRNVILALQDGTVFTGKSFGATGEVDGEVCFNTSMTGW